MSIADDLRAAARLIDERSAMSNYPTPDFALAQRLRAHADTIERVEKEMRSCGSSMVGEFRVSEWADALKGDAT